VFIVIDTNLWVSGLLWRGLPWRFPILTVRDFLLREFPDSLID